MTLASPPRRDRRRAQRRADRAQQQKIDLDFSTVVQFSLCMLSEPAEGAGAEAGAPLFKYATVRAALGRLRTLSVFLGESILYGAFVWARSTLKHQNCRFPAPGQLFEETLKKVTRGIKLATFNNGFSLLYRFYLCKVSKK